jgi:LacI family transcriptional regulator
LENDAKGRFGTRKPIRRVTIRDVAEAAAVSPSTVSNALTRRRYVAPEIIARVIEAVDRLGYKRDLAASSLRSAESLVIGVVIPELTNPFFANIVERISARALSSGRRVIVGTSMGDPETEAAEIAAIAAWRPAGVIAVPCDGAFAAADRLDADGIPFVIVDRVPDDEAGYDIVAVDNEGGARDAAERLIEDGYRHVAVLASSLSLRNIRERTEGAMTAFQTAGVEAVVLEAGFIVDEIAQIVGKLLVERPQLQAIFALNNRLTLGALKAILGRGLKPGIDVMVVSFDDYEWMRVFNPEVSAVQQPVKEIADAAFDRLMKRIAGDDSPAASIRLPVSLEWRGLPRS